MVQRQFTRCSHSGCRSAAVTRVEVTWEGEYGPVRAGGVSTCCTHQPTPDLLDELRVQLDDQGPGVLLHPVVGLTLLGSVIR